MEGHPEPGGDLRPAGLPALAGVLVPAPQPQQRVEQRVERQPLAVGRTIGDVVVNVGHSVPRSVERRQARSMTGLGLGIDPVAGARY
jgi:hypothetical protein